MEAYIFIIVFFGVFAFLIFCLLFFVNRLTFMKLDVLEDFVHVREFIDERISLFKSMKSFLENDYEQESEFIEKLNDVIQTLSVVSAQKWESDFKESDELFLKFSQLDKIYPKIKKKSEFQSIIDGYHHNVDQVNYIVDAYDKGVKKYNDYRNNKYLSNIFRLFKFPIYDLYEEEK